MSDEAPVASEKKQAEGEEVSDSPSRLSERDYDLKLRKMEYIARGFGLLIRAVVLLGIAWCIKEVLVAHAGEETLVTYMANLQVSEIAGEVAKWVTIALLGIWGYAERRSRKRYIERHNERVRALEEELDPERDSSTLSQRGETPEEVLP